MLNPITIDAKFSNYQDNEYDIAVEVFVTSLMDQEEFPHDIFSNLYQLRWYIEESYKVMKSRLEIENFSDKSSLAILQDFYAKLFVYNLTSILTWSTKEELDNMGINRKHKCQLHFTQALNRMKDSIVLLFIRSQQKVPDYIERLTKLFIGNLEIIRPNRKNQRKFRKVNELI